ncbi:dTDP-4-dehydrorhamnose reductase [Algibacter sp. 2305UL17-15]|uniref:dTDP-4-dehydrorhamnose reductase n=1 Tax=Algibacter sp. 2305UL17-15 TaxID=3231268 RepID=UPI003457E810
MNIKVLVTGANGQLGKTIEELFENNNDGIDFMFLSKSELDITDKDALNDVFQKNSFNYCMNCAAYTNVEQAEKTPDIAYKINAEGVKNLAEICKEQNTILLHISTDYVFDGTKRTPYTISDKTNPINEYGTSKLLGEQYIQQLLKKYFIIRTSWLYSKKYGKNFYKTIIEKSKTESKLSITDSQKSCPTNTVTLARFIYNLIKKNTNHYGLYHFSDDKVMTWYDFAEQILIENELFDKINLVKADNYVTFAKRPEYSVLANN